MALGTSGLDHATSGSMSTKVHHEFDGIDLTVMIPHQMASLNFYTDLLFIDGSPRHGLKEFKAHKADVARSTRVKLWKAEVS